MSSLNKVSFILPFQCERFLFLFLIYSLGMISSTMSTRNGEKENDCIIPYTRGKTLSFIINCAMICSFFFFFLILLIRLGKLTFIGNLVRNFISV